MMTARCVLAALLLIVAIAAGGCRKEEQDRPLSFEPGVYKGQKDEPLSEQNRRDLGERAKLMR